MLVGLSFRTLPIFYPQCSLQALLHEELGEVKRRRTQLRAELRAASKEDKKLRKRRANLVKASNSSCIGTCLAVLASCLVCVADRCHSQFSGGLLNAGS